MVGNAVAVHVLVLVVDVRRTLERVGTRLCHGVDASAYEVGLAHVIRGHYHLHFVYCVHRDRVASTGQSVVQAEVVVQVRAVEGEVCRASVAAAEAHAVGVRRYARYVLDAAIDGRQGLYLRVRDVCRGAGLLGGELRRAAHYHDFAQFVDVLAHGGVEVVRLAQCEADAPVVLFGVADVRYFHRVRASHAHTLYGPASVSVGDGVVGRTRRLVGHSDCSTDNVLAFGAGHLSRHRRRGNLCVHCCCHHEHDGGNE